MATDAEKSKKETVESGADDQHKIIGVTTSKAEEDFQRTSHPDAQWFDNHGLGLFVHWGISSVHGKADLSWSMIANTIWDVRGVENGDIAKLPPNEYFKLAEDFNPQHYNPDKWIKTAKDAGFTYAVFTTKHHDGYSMWPSKYGEFGVNSHLGGRDLVQPFVDACRKHGLRVGLYYSPPDWYYNQDYMTFHYGSHNDPRFTDRVHFDTNHQPIKELPEMPEGFEEGFHAFVKGQTEELLTNYGKIDILFFDGGPNAISFERIRELQPGIVVNPRMHGYGDYLTPECSMPEQRPKGWWELNEGWNMGAWGYLAKEDYHPTSRVLSRFAQVRAWGGNYLLNAAPNPDGEMPDNYYKHMAELTQWMENHSEACFDTQPGFDDSPSDTPSTRKGNATYLWVLPAFQQESIAYPVHPTEGTPVKATLLRDHSTVPFTYQGDTLTFSFPLSKRIDMVDIIKIEFESSF